MAMTFPGRFAPSYSDDTIDYVDMVPRRTWEIRKQMWNDDTQQFEEIRLWHVTKFSLTQTDWLTHNYGVPNRYAKGRYWSQIQNRLIMDEAVYICYCLKWGQA
jgi:hypothetical protein